jgi:hypothetical protein
MKFALTIKYNNKLMYLYKYNIKMVSRTIQPLFQFIKCFSSGVFELSIKFQVFSFLSNNILKFSL